MTREERQRREEQRELLLDLIEEARERVHCMGFCGEDKEEGEMDEYTATELAYKKGAKDMADRVKEIAARYSFTPVQFNLLYQAIDKVAKEMGVEE
jgi:hypothetical protein